MWLVSTAVYLNYVLSPVRVEVEIRILLIFLVMCILMRFSLNLHVQIFSSRVWLIRLGFIFHTRIGKISLLFQRAITLNRVEL